ncbi:hypothetical protein GMJLKIPL_0609 [Methylobacterium isbiliense]|uniref:Uncharacterized protein n=1 Tax=Methylobacterium isbiliense TaxID=315478 RepID=A0ABQ4S892_9HYPH|nr:hypothetical protein GMJLKIPL_0609 [Methylobacterium isbiliense]
MKLLPSYRLVNHLRKSEGFGGWQMKKYPLLTRLEQQIYA